MPAHYEIALMSLGAALIVAAVASGWLPGRAAGTTGGSVARALAAVAGAVLIAWTLLSPGGPGGLARPTVNAGPPGPSAAELVGSASRALQACAAATAPAIPDGAAASLEEMQAADAAFRAYDTATNSYTRCVDAAVGRVAQQFAGVAETPDLQALTLFGTRAHNVAIDREQAAVDRFNVQLRIYKAKHHRS